MKTLDGANIRECLDQIIGSGTGEELADWLEMNGLTDKEAETVRKLILKAL